MTGLETFLFIVFSIACVVIFGMVYMLLHVIAQRDELANKIKMMADFIEEVGNTMEKMGKDASTQTNDNLVKAKELDASLDRCIELFHEKSQVSKNLGTYDSKGKKV